MLAIYTRLSREDEESTSINNQLREGVEFANINGFQNYEIYNEGEGVSGTLDLDQRPQLSKLINDIKKNKFKAIWFRNQNRLGRSMETHVAFIGACVKNKTKVFFDNREFDYTDPTEDLVGNVLSSLNVYTAKLQSKQTKKALLDNVKQGRAHSIIAYGYSTDDGGFLMVEPTESKIVKRMYVEHARGVGCSTIAKNLTAEGVPTRYGKITDRKVKWSDKAVRDILRNTLYYGKRNWGDEKYDAPAIVSKELWDESIEAFKTNMNTRSLIRTDHKYLLNGIIICGMCGRRMLGRRKYNKRGSFSDNAYTCAGKRLSGDDKCHNRSINIPAMEDFVWTRFFIDKQFIKLVEDSVEVNRDKSKYAQLVETISEIDSEIKKLTIKRGNAVRLAIDGVLSDDDVKNELKTIDKQITEHKLRKRKFDEDLDFIKNVEDEYVAIRDHIENLKTDTPFNTKREVIHKYVDTITVNSIERDHILWMKFNMNVEEETYMRLNGEFHVFNDLGADLVPFNKEGITNKYE